MTKFTKLIIGTAFSLGVLNTAAVGSVVMRGDVVHDTSGSQTQAFNVVVDTGSILSFTGTTLSASGSLPGHNRACVGNPYTGSGLVWGATLECANAPSGVNTDAGLSVTSGGSGTDLWNNAPTGTSALLYNLTGALVLPPSQFICAVSSTGANALDDCMFKVWMSEQYVP